MAKKDKNKKDRPHHNTNGRSLPPQFRDMTAERQYNLVMNRAIALHDERKFEEVVELLDPVTSKFPTRPDLFDLLAVSYNQIGMFDTARDLMLYSLSLAPRPKSMESHSRYNVAQVLLPADLLGLAYEQNLKISCDEVKGGPERIKRCYEMDRELQKEMKWRSAQAKMPLEDYVELARLVDLGRLAMIRSRPDPDLDESMGHFEEARRQYPTSPLPLINMTILYHALGQPAQAIATAQQVLTELDPRNVDSLSNLIQALVWDGKRDEALIYLARLEKLPKPPSEDPATLIKWIEAYIALEDDARVYELTAPFRADIAQEKPTYFGYRLGTNKYFLTMAHAMVALANLGRRREALELTGQLNNLATANGLIGRLAIAIRNYERGPRDNNRFWYWTPGGMYPAVGKVFDNVQAEMKTQTSGRPLRPFFARYGRLAYEFLTYYYWSSFELEESRDFWTRVLDSGEPGVPGWMRGLALGRTGNEPQRLLLASVLAEHGFINPSEEKLTMWIGLKPATATLEKLAQRLMTLDADRKVRSRVEHSPEVAELMNTALKEKMAGHDKDALRLYSEVLEKDPTLKQALYHLASLQLRRGKRDEAQQYIDQALAIDPHYAHGLLSRADLFMQRGEFADAEVWLNQAEAWLNSFSLDEVQDFYLTRYRWLAGQQRWSEALVPVQNILEIEPTIPWAVEALSKLSAMGLADVPPAADKTRRTKARK